MALPDEGWAPAPGTDRLVDVALPEPYVAAFTEGGPAPLARTERYPTAVVAVVEGEGEATVTAGVSEDGEPGMVAQLVRRSVYGVVLLDAFTLPAQWPAVPDGCTAAALQREAEGESGVGVREVATEAAFQAQLQREAQTLAQRLARAIEGWQGGTWTLALADAVDGALALPPGLGRVLRVEALTPTGDARPVTVVPEREQAAALDPAVVVREGVVVLVRPGAPAWARVDRLRLVGDPVARLREDGDDELAPDTFHGPLYCRALALSGAAWLAAKAGQGAHALALRAERQAVLDTLIRQLRGQDAEAARRHRSLTGDLPHA